MNPLPMFPPCSPESPTLDRPTTFEPSHYFCEKWNPDFTFNGRKCCSLPPLRGKRKRKLNRCSPQRTKKTYCEEMTQEQKEYSDAASKGKLGDLLYFLTEKIGQSGDQAYCTVNTGFLAHGRQIISTQENRLFIRSPDRCLNFGTDAMAAMLEWLGREIKIHFTGVQNINVRPMIGDVAAPRGGCLYGRSGRRGHSSHTSGQDADIGFILPKTNLHYPPTQFTRRLDLEANWWFLKKVFSNPYACIKIIFLDRHHIHLLAQYARNDPDWNTYRRFIRHMPGHQNHFHIRIGNGPGSPGCSPGFRPELESEDNADS